jgi:Helicase HerA, central domain
MTSRHDAVLSVIGENVYHGRRSLIGITQADRLGHMWVLGQTGTGKSTLLTNLIYEDMQAGRGLMVIDPHGDLVETLLDLVPPHRVPTTIYFNPADTAYPLAFNPLDYSTGLPASLVASGMLSVLKKTWPEFWGPRLEYVLRSSLSTLIHTPHATLLDLHRLLVDLPFRQQIISRLTDPQLLQFWYKEFATYSAGFRTEAVSPIVNKTGQYLTIPLLRNILGQRKSALALHTLMDAGTIILVNLAKGRLGEDVAALLGSLLMHQVELAALSRAAHPVSKRRDYFLYVDEAHLVATTTMIELFPEARKYHLGVILAHQYLDQLPEDLRCALLGNVGTLAVFRVGGRDAEVLGAEFAPECRAADLMYLPAHQMCLKLLVNGTTSSPFTVSTFPTPQPHISQREHIIAATRERYCHPVVEVERDIMRSWHTNSLATQPQQRLQFSP